MMDRWQEQDLGDEITDQNKCTMAKIYTKTGDKGLTSLIGGTRVAKNNIRLEAYGTVDELNAYIGMIRSFKIDSLLIDELAGIQQKLFAVGGNLATDRSVKDIQVKTVVNPADIECLEQAIDRMDAELPPLTHFVLPGGSQEASFVHIARTVCRRAERRILDMNENYPVDEPIIRYINRLSDYLFILSRKLAYDTGAEELKWKP